MAVETNAEIRRIAEAQRILTHYTSWKQTEIQVSDATLDAVLSALDVPTDTPADRADALNHTPALTPASVDTTIKMTWPTSLQQRPAWGVQAQLYSVRSHDSWGIGDFVDLADIAEILAAKGADFVLINPVHAAELSGPMSDSPYLPTSRVFLNPIYIRPQATPEYHAASPELRAVIDGLATAAGTVNTVNELLDRDRSWSLKRTALQYLFDAGIPADRNAALDDYAAAKGADLKNFALWNVLQERTMVEELPSDSEEASRNLSSQELLPNSPEAAAFAAEHRDELRFQYWLQFLAEEQLATAQQRALDAGMRVGVVGDLAVGVHPCGADAWTYQDVLARGVSVGAPPDFFNQQGQDWSQPPLRPDRLAATDYQVYRTMLRAVLTHAGGLRIDHILGLFRLWWIPSGEPASAGTYVYYDHDAMVSILAEEAQRADSVIVGEDIGVVMPWTRDYLESKGVGGNSIIWFEPRHQDGTIADPQDYRAECLSMTTSHDLPPTASYLRGQHIDLRAKYGLLTVPESAARAEADAERAEMVSYLVNHGFLAPEDRDDIQQIVFGMYRFLKATPSRMLAVALVDMVGETRSQNLPGTFQEYPNWRVPLADASGTPVLVEDLAENPLLNEFSALMNE